MSERDRIPHEDVMRSLIRHERPEKEAGACPDSATLAAMAEGRLQDREREEMESHLARCGDCREILLSLPEPDVPSASSSRAPGRLLRLGLPVAAAVLLLASAGIAFLLFSPDAAPRDTGKMLSVTAKVLGFTALDEEELLDVPTRVSRGGLFLLRPAGTVLDPSPDFDWGRVATAERYRVTVYDAAGRPIWSRETREPKLAYPEGVASLDPDATHLWELTVIGPLGEESGRRSFRVASEGEAEAYLAKVEEIRRQAPPWLEDLLIAHLALRKELLLEAEKAARSFLARKPADELGRLTLHHVLTRLGAPEADRWRPVAKEE